MLTAEAPRAQRAPAPPETGRVVLIAGGDADPHLLSLAKRALEREIPVLEFLTGADRTPSIAWDMEADTLLLDGQEARPGAGFLRYDVFHTLADKRPAVEFRAQAWHTALHGWMLAHDDVRMLNRGFSGLTNKPHVLTVAAACGLRIPRTLVTNDLEMLDTLQGSEGMIAKPVPGGGFTQGVADLLRTTPRREGKSAAPAFVQNRLVAPEVRIYGVGGRFVPYHVISDHLDYRADDDSRVEPLPVEQIDAGVLAGMSRLMDRLRMEYGAADFKTDADTGELVFMEINSGPMFAGFDRVSSNAVSDAILDYLTR
ncbi:MAG TPA: hypothetical protein VE871_14610 [Longimicrobium sp.]|nr:hypothetical protein [Longimicrobium sp.]